MTKALAYLRLSKAEDGHGIEVQRASLERFFERRQLELPNLPQVTASLAKLERRD